MDDKYLTGALWRHNKSGDLYRIIGFSTREDDMLTLVTYQKNGVDQPIWTRTVDEFFDGRFVRWFPDLRE